MTFTSFKIPEDSELENEKIAHLSEAVSTGFWSADNAGVKPGDTLIVLGCGPIGLMAQKAAWLKGAKQASRLITLIIVCSMPKGQTMWKSLTLSNLRMLAAT